MEPPTEDVKGKIESKNCEMFEIEGVNDLKAKDFKVNFQKKMQNNISIMLWQVEFF